MLCRYGSWGRARRQRLGKWMEKWPDAKLPRPAHSGSRSSGIRLSVITRQRTTRVGPFVEVIGTGKARVINMPGAPELKDVLSEGLGDRT